MEVPTGTIIRPKLLKARRGANIVLISGVTGDAQIAPGKSEEL